MPTVNREAFLNALESCQPGLAQREILEQTSCFVFQGGYIWTYNEELCCRAKSPLNGHVTGAVQAEKLLAILPKLQAEDIEVEAGAGADAGRLVLKGRGWRTRIRMEEEVHLKKSLDAIEQPEGWQDLHPDFGDAVATVQPCAGKDSSKFSLTCVHVHPNWVEASDFTQFCRWVFENGTGFNESILLRRTAVKHISSLGMTQFCETPSWVHFKNPRGLVMSCRRYTDVTDFPVLDKFMGVRGRELKLLSKSLAESIDKAQVFVSPEGEANDHVQVTLKDNHLKLVGEGPQGDHTEKKKVKFDGDPVQFYIPPALLLDLVKNHSQFSVTDDHLIVDSGSYRFLTCLSKAADDGAKENGGGGEEDE